MDKLTYCDEIKGSNITETICSITSKINETIDAINNGGTVGKGEKGDKGDKGAKGDKGDPGVSDLTSTQVENINFIPHIKSEVENLEPTVQENNDKINRTNERLIGLDDYTKENIRFLKTKGGFFKGFSSGSDFYWETKLHSAELNLDDYYFVTSSFSEESDFIIEENKYYVLTSGHGNISTDWTVFDIPNKGDSGGGTQAIGVKSVIKYMGVKKYLDRDVIFIKLLNYPSSSEIEDTLLCYDNSEGELVYKHIRKNPSGEYYIEFSGMDKDIIPWNSTLTIVSNVNGSSELTDKITAKGDKFGYVHIKGVKPYPTPSPNGIFAIYYLPFGTLNHYTQGNLRFMAKRPSTGATGDIMMSNGVGVDVGTDNYKSTLSVLNGSYPHKKRLGTGDELWLENMYTGVRCSNIYIVTDGDVIALYGSLDNPEETPQQARITHLCNSDWKSFKVSPPHNFEGDKIIKAVYGSNEYPGEVVGLDEYRVVHHSDCDNDFIQFFDELDNPLTDKAKASNLDVHFH